MWQSRLVDSNRAVARQPLGALENQRASDPNEHACLFTTQLGQLGIVDGRNDCEEIGAEPFQYAAVVGDHQTFMDASRQVAIGVGSLKIESRAFGVWILAVQGNGDAGNAGLIKGRWIWSEGLHSYIEHRIAHGIARKREADARFRVAGLNDSLADCAVCQFAVYECRAIHEAHAFFQPGQMLIEPQHAVATVGAECRVGTLWKGICGLAHGWVVRDGLRVAGVKQVGGDHVVGSVMGRRHRAGMIRCQVGGLAARRGSCVQGRVSQAIRNRVLVRAKS